MAKVASQPAWVNCHPWASFVNVRKGDAQFLAVAMQMSEASFSSRFFIFGFCFSVSWPPYLFPPSFLAINYRALAGLLFYIEPLPRIVLGLAVRGICHRLRYVAPVFDKPRNGPKFCQTFQPATLCPRSRQKKKTGDGSKSRRAADKQLDQWIPMPPGWLLSNNKSGRTVRSMMMNRADRFYDECNSLSCRWPSLAGAKPSSPSAQ